MAQDEANGDTMPTADTVALGFELAASQLRLIQLRRRGDRAEIVGYASATRPDPGRLDAAIAQVIDGLGASTDAPMGITSDTGDLDLAAVADTVRAAGFGDVNVIGWDTTVDRAIGPEWPEPLVDFMSCPVPAGLLAAHRGLSVADLAPSVGAALDRLGLGHRELAGDLTEPGDPVVVWSPDDEVIDLTEAGGLVAASDAELVDIFDAADDAVDDPAEISDADDAIEELVADDAIDSIEDPAEIDDPDDATDLVADDTIDGADDRTQATDVALGAAAALGTAAAASSLGDGGELGDPSTDPAADRVADTVAAPVPSVAGDETLAAMSGLGEAPTIDGVADDDDSFEALMVSAGLADGPSEDPTEAPGSAAVAVAQGPDSSSGWSRVAVLALIALAIGALALILSNIFGGDETADDPMGNITTLPAAADSETDPAAAVANEPEPTAVPEPTAEPTSAPTAEPTAVPESTATQAPTAAPTAEPTATPQAAAPVIPLSELPERGAVYVAAEETMYLRGPVTAEEGAELEARAIEVLGPDRVVNEYIYRDDAPPVTEGTVRVEQAVLFETGSAVIADEFKPTLELGVLVMNLNPQVTMVVEGHTDSVGGDDFNQALSEARAQSVVEYLVGRGIERERLEPVGFGETQPIADNDTAEGRQLNRRIEVDLLDLLSPRPAE